LLIEDTRITHRRVAELTGLPESTARTRLQRIIASGRVTPSILIHPRVDGERIVYMVRLIVGARDVERLIDHGEFTESPWVARVDPSGEVIAQFSAGTPTEMAQGIDSVRRAPGVVRVSVSMVTRIYVGARFEAGDALHAEWSATPTRDVDAADRVLVSGLRLDGRASYTDLAAAVGLTVAATRRRVIRLVEDGLIRFATRVNDESLAMNEAAIDLSVDSADLAGFVRDVCERRAVRYVIEQTGSRPLAAYLVESDPDALTAAIEDILRDPRVRDHRVDRLAVLQDRLSWFGEVS
jgi:DNA-binding Lrp family transcriptional regulator